LLFTSRYPFHLPDNAEETLEAIHLGPLSAAETRKLGLRLRGLNTLSPEQLKRAYEEVGGHPRALEYLDALLRGGKAHFSEVEKKLRQALKARGIEEPARWRANVKGQLDRALAETATLAADDVLLDALLGRLDSAPLAHRLLVGVSVCRLPIDEWGLIWQVGKRVERRQDSERTQRLEKLAKAVQETQSREEPLDLKTLGLSQAEIDQFRQDYQEEYGPPVATPEGFEEALDTLEALSLLSPIRYAEAQAIHYLVHRWTATALARRMVKEEIVQAHRQAAQYWRWFALGQTQPRPQDVEMLLEARYHHRSAGESDQAVEVTEWVVNQLETWGAWQREEQLCKETLSWLPEKSAKAAVFLHTLGIASHNLGDYDRALEWYQKALDIDEALGNRAGIALTLSNVGILYTRIKTPEEGIPLNLESLLTNLELQRPEYVRTDLYWLNRQRALLGEEPFLSIVQKQLNEDDTQALIQILDEYKAADKES
jgi:tetratricopeptide (TPR) repeat protein